MDCLYKHVSIGFAGIFSGSLLLAMLYVSSLRRKRGDDKRDYYSKLIFWGVGGALLIMHDLSGAGYLRYKVWQSEEFIDLNANLFNAGSIALALSFWIIPRLWPSRKKYNRKVYSFLTVCFFSIGLFLLGRFYIYATPKAYEDFIWKSKPCCTSELAQRALSPDKNQKPYCSNDRCWSNGCQDAPLCRVCK